MRTLRVLVLASGKASTFEAVLREIMANLGKPLALSYEIVCVVSNHHEETRKTVDRLNKEFQLDIPLIAADFEKPTKDARAISKEESSWLLRIYKIYKCDLCLCLGWDRILAGPFLEELSAKIINTHPGILPETKDTYGIAASKRVIELGCKETAHSIFAVGPGIDDAPVLCHSLVKIPEDPDPEVVFAEVQIAEKRSLAWKVEVYIREFQRLGLFGPVYDS